MVQAHPKYVFYPAKIVGVQKYFITISHLFIYIDFIKMIFFPWMDSFKCTRKIVDKIDSTASRKNGALKLQIPVFWIYFSALSKYNCNFALFILAIL